ncbi:hypothetical protein M1N91_02840 [Dehalococcoidia bacterium]|nr:hypothetical protein [Dehalococcoidia bacterium]
MEMIRKLRRKYRLLHPVNTAYEWEGLNDYRLAVITKDGRNILFSRIILVLGILGGMLGLIYWGALWFRGLAEERGIIDVIEPLYYVAGFYLLAITGLIVGATLLIWSISQEEELDELMRSLLTPRDLSFYKGFRWLTTAIIVTFLIGVLALFFAKIVWRLDLADFFSGGLVILFMSVSFCILGNLLISFVAICIPPRLRQRVVVGLAIFVAVLLIAVAFYFAYVWEGDIEPSPDIPTAWDIEFFYLMEDEAWLAKESLMRLMWLIIGLALAGGIGLRHVWPLAYRTEKGPMKSYDVDISLSGRWETRFVALLGRLPLDDFTKAFLKKDLILYFRNHSALAQTILLIGVVLAATLAPEEVPVGFLFMLYFAGIHIVPNFLNPSLRTEGSNMDYTKILLEKGKFIAAKVVTTSIVVLPLCLILLFSGYAFSPALEWDYGSIVIRMLIVTMAVLQGTLLAMVCGEQILISGKQSVDQAIAYFCFGLFMAGGWAGIDFFLINPQVLPTWAIAYFPHVPLIIFGAVIFYSLFRLRKFARAIEDV